MNTRWTLISATALSLTFAAGCNRQETATTQTTPASTSPSLLANEDKEFVTKASQGGMLEVALGREAARKATSAEVKSFGEHMVTDHSKANEELSQLAARKGAVVATELDNEHREKLDKLSKLSGDKFDQEYADAMVEDHEEDVSEFSKASKNAKDADLRTWAAKTLPVLESHLAMAKEVKAKVKR
jgi:putative membrane protein